MALDMAGNYVMTGSQIGAHSFRMTAQAVLKGDVKAWKRYDRTRADVSEALALAAVSRALSTPAAHADLYYDAPKRGVSPDARQRVPGTPGGR